ncbi:hypothetical protein [Psychromonas sp. Urea-02u-13]|uniref:hypothetical protein n=1 Tax=Psychromonas sp. Urea-02u-13 TaxID=2058326 RepID=UPI000C342E1E|nr:hypothetical protein [Psychromonas sp. Urea-02u-13]PKG40212.1 hypothetical protein CXF74_03835 [Psychromonas sp. Urea-02u-13]
MQKILILLGVVIALSITGYDIGIADKVSSGYDFVILGIDKEKCVSGYKVNAKELGEYALVGAFEFHACLNEIEQEYNVELTSYGDSLVLLYELGFIKLK